jgi:hypothetical protein
VVTKTEATSELLDNSMLKVDVNRVDTIVGASTLINCKPTSEESLLVSRRVLVVDRRKREGLYGSIWERRQLGRLLLESLIWRYVASY